MDARPLDLFEAVAASAQAMPKDVFNKPDDDWIPVVFLDGPEGTATVPVYDFMDSDEKKDLLTHSILPAMISQFKATSVVILISAWVSAKATESYEGGGGVYIPPSQQPDREERVLIVEYTREGITRQAWAPILRSETEVPQLGEWDDQATLGVDGRFVAPIVKALKGVKA